MHVNRVLMGLAVVSAFIAAEACSSAAAPSSDGNDAGALPSAPPDVDAPASDGSAACSSTWGARACTDLGSAPETTASIATFIEKEAIPLRCEGTSGEAPWDLSALVDAFGSRKVFALGEVHGTNEIGLFSARLLEALASRMQFDVLAFEMPMDWEAAFQKYVDTGSDPRVEELLRSWSPTFMGATLTKKARELATRGIHLSIGAVEIPSKPDFAAHAIEEIAAGLTMQRSTVVTSLPTGSHDPATPEERKKASDYFDHIMSHKAEICAELQPEKCERLVAMTHALWASTNYPDGSGDVALWLARREEVIYYNLRSKIVPSVDKLYVHMGQLHVNKHKGSATSRLDKELGRTKGKVFSVAPAYGEGSVISYDGAERSLPAEPESIAGALKGARSYPLFVSTTRPGVDCTENPLATEPEPRFGFVASRGQLFDGYVYYGRLTSEQHPDNTSYARERETPGGNLESFRLRIAEHERRALASMSERELELVPPGRSSIGSDPGTVGLVPGRR